MPHIHEKIDFTVTAYIINDGRVLLRKHEKYDIWLPPGGHIELDEDPIEAVHREIKEEVGLDIELVGNVPKITEEGDYKELLPPRFMNIHSINDTHRHVDLIYIARSQSDQVNPTGDDISNEWHWFTKEELNAKDLDIKETIRHYALTALEQD